MPDDPLRVVELAERSDTGRVRDHNEDRSYASPTLVAVADGMGGALAGEVAAQIAVDAMDHLTAPMDAREVQRAIEQANRTIRDMASRDAGKAGMGTTMTAVTVDGARADIVHVGDSRAYLWRDGMLRQLTDDHSVVAELVRRGSISEEEAEHHPHRNVITRALGAEPDVQVDRVSEELHDGDVLLLCSDGLYGEVGDAEIIEVLSEAASLDAAAGALVERANRNGGSDNVTVVLARMGHGPAAEALSSNRSPDTAEFPVLGGHGEGVANRTTTVIGGLRASQPEGAAPAGPARVLQPIGRRRRIGPPLAAGLVVIVLIGGAAAWAVSRSYAIDAGPGGTLWVRQGLELGPLDLSRDWQDTGVPAAEVTGGPRDGDVGDVGGQGATVLRATRIIWADGITSPPALRAAQPDRRVPGLGPLATNGDG